MDDGRIIGIFADHRARCQFNICILFAADSAISRSETCISMHIAQ